MKKLAQLKPALIESNARLIQANARLSHKFKMNENLV